MHSGRFEACVCCQTWGGATGRDNDKCILIFTLEWDALHASCVCCFAIWHFYSEVTSVVVLSVWDTERCAAFAPDVSSTPVCVFVHLRAWLSWIMLSDFLTLQCYFPSGPSLSPGPDCRIMRQYDTLRLGSGGQGPELNVFLLLNLQGCLQAEYMTRI